LVYGEGHPEAVRRNLKGKPFQHYDGAGVVSNWEFDFKGNLLRGSRQLAKDYKQLVDWMVLAGLTEIPLLVQAAIALLEPKTFDSSTMFDGMNRPISMTMPDRSVVMPIFNEANLLNQVKVKLQGAEAETLFVKNIDYDEKGQRSLIEYGNDATNQGVVKTEFRFDPETFRLMGLKTTRKADGVRLQDLNYTYDPVGNITTIRDDAQQIFYFDGEVVSPSTQYQYDALYRLIQADGREHIGQTTNQPPQTNPGLKPQYDSNDWTRSNLPLPQQVGAMRNYTEAYEYDEVGNILAMIHQATGSSWTRRYDYEATNNRLRTTSFPGDGDDVTTLPSRYEYDLHGNMVKMPHLPLMRWDFKDQLQATSQQVRNDGGTPEITYYVYDASGQRVRKVTEAQAVAGSVPKRMNERMYLGGFEVYREYGSSDSVKLERETLHIMDDQQRIALVETKTVTNPDDESPTQLIRFQFGNHLGSASLEVDDGGRVISYEEYYPYGSTAYQAVDKGIKAAGKRYRYTGMERDDETGLNYHSARYYVPWLGRWASADPSGMTDGPNLYNYVIDNPIRLTDLNGCGALDFLEDVAVGPLLGEVKHRLEQSLPSSNEGEDSSAHLRVKNMPFSEAAISGGGLGVLLWGLSKAPKPSLSSDPIDLVLGGIHEASELINDTIEAPFLSAHQAGEEAAKATIAADKGDISGVYNHMNNAVAYSQLSFAQAYLLTDPISRYNALGKVGTKAGATASGVDVSESAGALGETKPSILTSEPTPSNLTSQPSILTSKPTSSNLTSQPLSSQPAGLPRLDTNTGKKFHYTNVADPVESFSQGVRANTSFTGEGNLSPRAAQTRLGIPRPDYVVVVEDIGQFRPNTPPTVQPVPNRGFLGGGSDYVNTKLVSPEQIEGIYGVSRTGVDWSLNIWEKNK
jgi:RHS repeat-associated protein